MYVIEEWKAIPAHERHRSLRYRNRHAAKILSPGGNGLSKRNPPYKRPTILSCHVVLSNSAERYHPVQRPFITLRTRSGSLIKVSGCAGARYV